MKLLCLCDSPTLTTGFACVARNLFSRWSKLAGVEIDVWGIGFNGWGYRAVPYRVFPGGAGGEWASLKRLQMFLNQLAEGNYTHCWMMQDSFALSAQSDFPQEFQKICQQKNIRSVYYFPVDAPLDPLWTGMMEHVDVPVAYTRYGKAEMERAMGDRLDGAEAIGIKASEKVGVGESETHFPTRSLSHFPHPIQVLPHGVDPSLFHPMPPMRRVELRQKAKVWSPAWVGPDDFLMINVNMHQQRKDVTRSFEILRKLIDRNIPAKLWMHMDETNDAVSLGNIALQMGLKFGTDWGLNAAFFHNGHSVIGEKDMVKFYNVSDLLLSTSLGEGWGLSITEGLACGLPIAAPQHTACAEIMDELTSLGMGERCVPLPVEKNQVVLANDNSRIRYRVDVTAAADAIESYYHSQAWQQRPEMNSDVRRWLSWDRIAVEMMAFLKTNAAGARREAMGDRKPITYRLSPDSIPEEKN